MAQPWLALLRNALFVPEIDWWLATLFIIASVRFGSSNCPRGVGCIRFGSAALIENMPPPFHALAFDGSVSELARRAEEHRAPDCSLNFIQRLEPVHPHVAGKGARRSPRPYTQHKSSPSLQPQRGDRSPGLVRLRTYPGCVRVTLVNPKGLRLGCNLSTQPPLGLRFTSRVFPRVGSFLATLGFVAESLWDSRKELHDLCGLFI